MYKSQKKPIVIHETFRLCNKHLDHFFLQWSFTITKNSFSYKLYLFTPHNVSKKKSNLQVIRRVSLSCLNPRFIWRHQLFTSNRRNNQTNGLTMRPWKATLSPGRIQKLPRISYFRLPPYLKSRIDLTTTLRTIEKRRSKRRWAAGWRVRFPERGRKCLIAVKGSSGRRSNWFKGKGRESRARIHTRKKGPKDEWDRARCAIVPLQLTSRDRCAVKRVGTLASRDSCARHRENNRSPPTSWLVQRPKVGIQPRLPEVAPPRRDLHYDLGSGRDLGRIRKTI